MMLVLNVAISASDNEGTVKAGGMPGRKIKFRYGMFFTGEYGMGDDNKEDQKAGVSLKSVFYNVIYKSKILLTNIIKDNIIQKIERWYNLF